MEATTTFLHKIGGGLSNDKPCSDNLLQIRRKRSLNNVQYAMNNEIEYMPSWFKSVEENDYLYSIDENWYLRKNNFPTIINQTQWDGIYVYSSGGKSIAYDGSISWGKQLFSVGSCVSCAVACAMQIFNFLKTGDKDMFSILWLHGNHTYTEKTKSSFIPNPGPGPGPVPNPSKDDGGKGAYMEEVLDKLVSDGAVRYSVIHPYMSQYNQLQYDTEPFGMPGIGTARQFVLNNYNELLPKAKQYRLSYWERIGVSDVDAIKNSIKIYGCVCIRVEMSTDFDSDVVDQTNGTIIDRNPMNNQVSHILAVIGWKEISGILHWTCVNHWGNWGYKTPKKENESEEDYKYRNRTGLCFVPYNYSKLTKVWKLVPNIAPYFNWDYEKIQGGKFILTHKEWNRLATRIAYKFKQKLPNKYSTISTRYPGNRFGTYSYNCATRDLNLLNSNSNLSDVKSGDYIAAKHLNDLVDAVNTV